MTAPPTDAQQLAALQAELQACQASLDAAHKELEMLCYAVSHDLRAPLRAVDGFSKMLLNRSQDRLDDEDRRLLDVVRTSSTSMARLMDAMVDFSRLIRQPMQCTGLHMPALVSDAWAPLAPNFRGSFDRQALPDAQGDPLLIRQAWRELLSNAVKFSAGGPAPAIVVSGERQGDEWMYRVADNGVGFDMAYVHKLFAPMQRLHLVKEFPGSGFGLASVARIVARHEGRVGALAQPGQGATFWFTLPVRHPKSGDS